MNREAHIDAFLNRTNWRSAERSKLGQDASFRQYWRLKMNGRSVLLMDALPPEKPVSIFADIATFLRRHALHAPEIYALDEAHGLMLIEDFGDDTFSQVLRDQPDQEWALYELAIDTLATLHQIEPFDELCLGPYDANAINEELQLYLEWFFPTMSGKPATSVQASSFMDAWAESFKHLPAEHNVLVLRDYHVDNLMRLQGATNKTRCGILDFQDALMGSPAYDLVSLIEDARRDISPELKAHCLTRYSTAMADASRSTNPDKLNTAINVFGAQRHAKVLGIFIRLFKRDNKSLYLKHLPRVLALYLAAIEREPALAGVAKWTKQHLSVAQIHPSTIDR